MELLSTLSNLKTLVIYNIKKGYFPLTKWHNFDSIYFLISFYKTRTVYEDYG
jgi:hypothetical protein